MFLSLLRRIRRRPGTVAIHVGGLAVALAVCLLMGMYIRAETRVDRFHDAADRIVYFTSETASFGRFGANAWQLGTALREHSPHVEALTRLRTRNDRVIRQRVTEPHIPIDVIWADSNFVEVFTFPAVAGRARTALQDPNAIVLTEPLAARLFGRTDPIGQTVRFGEDDEERTVRAVLEAVPEASTVQFDALLPQGPPRNPTGWGSMVYETYARLDHPMTETEISKHVEAVVTTYDDSERRITFGAIPLTEVHLSGLRNVDGFQGQMRYLYIFGSAALLLLVVAGINYVNLSTVQGLRRARSIAIRKTMGATRGRLAAQLLGESMVLAGLAAVLGVGLAVAVLPAFNETMGTALALRHQVALPVLFVLGSAALVGGAAGAYPAAVVSRFRPTRILKQHQTTSSGGTGWMQRMLVVVQFAVAVVLIGGTVVIFQQLQHVQSRNLGFQPEQVVAFPLSPDARSHAASLREAAAKHPAVQTAALGTLYPSHPTVSLAKPPSRWSPASPRTEDKPLFLRPSVVSPEYVETLGLTVVAGRNFSRDRPSELKTGILLNETGARGMGWTPETAVGKPFRISDDNPRRVIGVVADFHIGSLHEPIEPVLLQATPSANWSSEQRLLVRASPEQIPEAVAHVTSAITARDRTATVEPEFLDAAFAEMYRWERRLNRLFGAFAFISVLLACLGLYGLVAHTVEVRRKEIGIRKALGASFRNVTALVSGEYVALLALALGLGLPAVYLLMQRWLDDFAYRIDLGAPALLGTAAIAITAAALGIARHLIRALRLDPAEALREE